MDAQTWDERYSSQERLFSGNPNGVLVDEAEGLPPGRALDLGAGEGADALWLADRGWRVTAVDISQVALDRAAASGGPLAERVAWTRADVTADPPPPGPFDLVSAHFFPLPVQEGHTALKALLETVAPGGTLLYVGHCADDFGPQQWREIDATAYYWPADVAEVLGDEWTIEVNEIRPRPAVPEGAHHTRDTVLRARRTG
ncbi:class I SAM-dependent methyltransferase [Nocardiopsis suaedae]|uniref:Class I SAM-dependent methyltransferase n=1 Tax=Nocardiopsis suaedae TaxID=3018444 RepID=A0ABT4TLS1_9ACTN|nr:class I SAM-dependent methyltransferase [Nocardiopsis suaedae]MDA2805642.1 class I SAM-dependent methyltransferase [Nocardiopsis suaedae]